MAQGGAVLQRVQEIDAGALNCGMTSTVSGGCQAMYSQQIDLEVTPPVVTNYHGNQQLTNTALSEGYPV